MSNKTISINMNLFKPKSKTRRAKQNKIRPPIPLISPNVLKTKLLKRIKEHKNKETMHLGKNKQGGSNSKNETENSSSSDFTDAVNYIQLLANQKKKEAIEKKTIRHHHSLPTTQSLAFVNLELPEELQEPLTPVSSAEPLRLHRANDVPYSNLKGGTKPTYREWSKTQRSNIVTNPSASLLVPTAREQRLAQLRAKIQGKKGGSSLQSPLVQVQAPIVQAPIVQAPIVQAPITQAPIVQAPIVQTPIVQTPIVQKPITQTPITQTPLAQLKTPVPHKKIIATKHITKKTIKRKYTLGRSRIKKTVGVLIKDKGTRKRVLGAQKDLKRKSINEIKEYLRQHNLIKVGSSAPNDVLRKLYESCMLAGEITNNNSDTLLHNFSKEDREI